MQKLIVWFWTKGLSISMSKGISSMLTYAYKYRKIVRQPWKANS
jgi:hypothetical protein